jgi:proline dehydrogenase
MLTGRLLDDRPRGLAGHLRGALRRLGEPVIRAAVAQAMREMGRQFVLGETIEGAMARAGSGGAGSPPTTCWARPRGRRGRPGYL